MGAREPISYLKWERKGYESEEEEEEKKKKMKKKKMKEMKEKKKKRKYVDRLDPLVRASVNMVVTNKKLSRPPPPTHTH